VEHTAASLVVERVFGIALGHEDPIDNAQLRHDPVRRFWVASVKSGAQILYRWPANRRSIDWS
jgi:hypothetical protein